MNTKTNKPDLKELIEHFNTTRQALYNELWKQCMIKAKEGGAVFVQFGMGQVWFEDAQHSHEILELETLAENIEQFASDLLDKALIGGSHCSALWEICPQICPDSNGIKL